MATALQFDTEPSVGSLSERAMTVSLHLSAWRAQRVDKRTTTEVLQERSAKVDAGRFEKFLVPPSALDTVSKAHSKARQRHYGFTLPWGDEAVRILAATAFFDYTQAMNEERASCEQAHQAFLARYPELVAEAPARLGPRLYAASDFPDVAEIREKFAFNLVVLPVPDKDDFRVSIGADAEARIRQSIERTVAERYSGAQRDLWTRLLDTVKHFAMTMADKDKVFRNSTVHKLAELAELAPKLSLAPDPQLEAVCAEVLALANSFAPDDLRANQLVRAEATRKARTTLKSIEAALEGAFV